MSDLVINVRQIGNYPASTFSSGQESVLVQAGSLGSSYQSMTTETLVQTALYQGSIGIGQLVPPGAVGQMFTDAAALAMNGWVGWNFAIIGGQAQYWQNANAALLQYTLADGLTFTTWPAGAIGQPIPTQGQIEAMVLSPQGDMSLPSGTLTVSRNPGSPMEVATMSYVGATTVASFNARRGQVQLNAQDVNSALSVCPPDFIATDFTVQQRLQELLAGHPFVWSFNARTGNIWLRTDDVSKAYFEPNSCPITPTPPFNSNDLQIANTEWVTRLIYDHLWQQLYQAFAPINSPHFTGIPTAPMAAPKAYDNQIATTAWVHDEMDVFGVASFNGRAGHVVLETSDITGAGGATVAELQHYLPLTGGVLNNAPNSTTLTLTAPSSRYSAIQLTSGDFFNNGVLSINSTLGAGTGWGVYAGSGSSSLWIGPTTAAGVPNNWSGGNVQFQPGGNTFFPTGSTVTFNSGSNLFTGSSFTFQTNGGTWTMNSTAMTFGSNGSVILGRNPQAQLEAVPLQYLQSYTAQQLSSYVPLAGNVTLQGPLSYGGLVSDADDLTNKAYVDQAVASVRTYQGTYDASTNTPDLTAVAPNNGDYWIVSTGGTLPAGVPGAGGQVVGAGDMLIWDDNTDGFSHIAAGGITQVEADARYVQLAGSTMTGNLRIATAASPTLTLGNYMRLMMDGTVPALYWTAAGQGIIHSNNATNFWTGGSTAMSVFDTGNVSFSVMNATVTFDGAASFTNPTNGFITVPSNQTYSANNLIPKYYADATYFPAAGGTLNGSLRINSLPNQPSLSLNNYLQFDPPYFDPSPDLSLHLYLYANLYGIGVTNNQLNYVVIPNTAWHSFRVAQTEMLRIGNDGGFTNYPFVARPINSLNWGTYPIAQAITIQNDSAGRGGALSFMHQTGATSPIFSLFRYPTSNGTGAGFYLASMPPPGDTTTVPVTMQLWSRSGTTYTSDMLVSILNIGNNPASTLGGSATINITASTQGSQVFLAGRRAQTFGGTPTLRWNMSMPDGTGEQGDNTGSNFQLRRFSDAGSQIGTSVIFINRATGITTFSNPVLVPQTNPTSDPASTATKAYVDAGAYATATSTVLGATVFGTLTANTTDITTATTISSGAPIEVSALTSDNTGLAVTDPITGSDTIPLTVGGTFQVGWTTNYGIFTGNMTVTRVTAGTNARTMEAFGTVTQTTAISGAPFAAAPLSFRAKYTQPGGTGTAISGHYDVSTVPGFFLPTAGGEMYGDILLPGVPFSSKGAIPKSYVEQIFSGSINNNIDVQLYGTLTSNSGDITTATSITGGGPSQVTAVGGGNAGLVPGDPVSMPGTIPLVTGLTFIITFTSNVGIFTIDLTTRTVTRGATSCSVTADGTITETTVITGTLLKPARCDFAVTYNQPGGPTTPITASRVRLTTTPVNGWNTTTINGLGPNNYLVTAGGTMYNQRVQPPAQAAGSNANGTLVLVQGGAADGTGTSGQAQIVGGNSSTAAGGNVVLQGGGSGGTSTGGTATVSGGQGGTTGNGGSVSITGANSRGNGTNGGNVTLQGGPAGGNTGASGNVNIRARTSNQPGVTGGNVIIDGDTGGGNRGYFRIDAANLSSVQISSLPVTDPLIPFALWIDTSAGNALKVSTG